jgi:dihydropyrimidinase
MSTAVSLSRRLSETLGRRSRSDRPRPKAYNPYEGREVTGVSETVLSRGRVIVDNGKFTGKPGSGSFLKRTPRTK